MMQIQFFTPEASGPGSNLLAEFRVDQGVDEWGGTLTARGCILMGREGRPRVMWPKGPRHFHATPGDRDTTARAEVWILDKWKTWKERR